MGRKVFSVVTAVLAVGLLAAALPWAIRDTLENGRMYLFSREFLTELPQRLTGPGKLRFIFQPVVAILLGWRGGMGDAEAGRPAYIYGLLLSPEHRREFLRSGLGALRDLLCMGILLDAVAQLLIYRQLHPGAALVVGPVLICLPYALSRALTRRVAGAWRSRAAT